MLRSYAGLLAPVALLVACSSQDRPPAAPLVDATASDGTAPDTALPIDAPSEAAGDTGVALDGTFEADAPTDAADDATPDLDVSDVSDVSDAGEAGDAGDAGEAGVVCHPALTTDASTGACKPVIQSWEDEGHLHLSPGDPTPYCTRPPSSGNHYGDWANFAVYDSPVPYGNLVHSLEHGAVVLFYKCPTAMLPCKTTQDALVSVAEAQPVDPICTAKIKRRIIVTPDPTLDVPIAASAWQWTYRADCVDATSLGSFITAHYAKATEDLCAAGIDPTM
jgi:hypothetical protein